MIGNDYTFNDAFKMPNKEDEKKIERAKKKAKLELELLSEYAANCLSSDDFFKYRRKFEDMRSEVIDVMNSYTNRFFMDQNGNLAMYGATMARYMQVLNDMNLLLKWVKTDAKRKHEKESK